MFFANIISVLFYILFFFIPLVLFPYTSEVFEFNKMVSVYILTALIVAFWLGKMVLQKKIVFRRTILDIPLLVFLCSQLISTLLSIDFRTSLFGYYSRFNGGLLSTICYSLLYWAYVSNLPAGKAGMDKVAKSIYALFASTLLVSIYGVLEHFGIDKDLWVQDVQDRVFSTFGQPNWLAAWLTALIPLTWSFALISNIKNQKVKIQIKNIKFWLWLILSSVFFITILFTKSRSGILGFASATVIFWSITGFCWLKTRTGSLSFLYVFLIFNISFLIFALLIGTPWTPSIFSQSTNQPINQSTSSGPALETGGTESGEIRKIVWKGAIEIWKHYPVFGTGPETFAYSYYNFRPVEHNLVSEWDFLYNKAHNEYLNYLANTGSVGLIAYLGLITFCGYIFVKNLQFTIYNSKSSSNLKISNFKFQILALASGWASILVTNFFGFSVVPTSLLFFLFPAMAVAIANKQQTTANYRLEKTSNAQKILLLIVASCLLIVIFRIAKYWYSDILYARGRDLNDQNQFILARKAESQAVSLSPKEALFWDELSQSDAGIAIALFEQKENGEVDTFAKLAISESQEATNLSPRNLNLKRSQASLFIKLSEIDSGYLKNAKDTLVSASALAPSDAKIFYNLGLVEYRLGETDEAISTLEKTIGMKSNYREARLALAIIFAQKGEKAKAKEELNYILTKIDPNDSTSKAQLEELGK